MEIMTLKGILLISPDLWEKEYHNKVTYGIAPEEWFEFFYPRTGVLGEWITFILQIA
jgi:hypothetical protein